MKGMLFSILEATDSLLAEGFRPERDVWIALGFDEETGGTQGALKIARYFEEQGIAFDAVYDEAGIIIAPGLGGIQRTAALVGTAEKGFSTIRITVRGTGGHSSMPPEKGSLVLAAEIIEMLNQERMPAFLTAPVIAFLDRIGGSMGVAQRTAIANRWLLESPLLRSFETTRPPMPWYAPPPPSPWPGAATRPTYWLRKPKSRSISACCRATRRPR